MTRYILISIVPLISGILYGQTAVEGVVLDPSGRPIPGARVECAARAVLSGPDGRFRVAGVERCQARVEARGFETERLHLVAGLPARVQLAIATLAQRLVVSATRHQTTIEETGVAADVILRADLARREFPAVPELLRQIPGLEVARYGRPGSLTQVFTRGSQRTGTLVLIDGVPVNDPGGELNLAHLTSSSIDRMEVVRGPESALFGAEASAGVIQLFTRRGNPENKLPRGSASYERGSFQSDRWIADLSGGSGARLDYALTAEQFHTAGQFPNDAYRNTSGAANVGFRLSASTQARAIFRSSDAFIGVPNQVAYGIIDFDATEASRDSVLALRVDDLRGRNFLQHFSFGYHRLRDLYLDSAPDGPYTVAALLRDVTTPVPRTYLERLVPPTFPPSAVPPGTRLVTQTVDYLLYPSGPFLTLTSRKSFEYQGTLSHSSGVGVFGYEYERQGGDITGRQAQRDNHAVFLHKQQRLGGRVFLSGGFRLEQNSAFHTKLTPRAAASFLLSGQHGPLSSTFLRASAARGITEPTLVQNFARDPYYVGNLALRPEKTASYDAGLVQEWFGRRLRTEVSLFDSSFKDLIVFVFLPYPQPSTWQNVEASRARGLEFSAQARFARYFSVSGNYTRMWTRITRSSSPNSLFTGVGQELARRPGNSAAFSISVSPKRWWLQAGAVLMGERQDTDLFGVTRNPGYQNVHAGAAYRLNPHATPFLRADNLLNTRYQEVLGYSNLARSIYGGVRLQW
jgi:outer membrane cobalamin receptor